MNRIVVTASLFFISVSLQAEVILTLESAIARARATAPTITAARLQGEEARGRLRGASLLLSENPTLEALTGSRTGQTRSTEFELAIEQQLDLPYRRRARISGARAVVAQEEQRVRETEREVLRDVASTFVSALAAQERIKLAGRSKELADQTRSVAERRFGAGDVAMLDVNIARTAAARADAELRVTTALRDRELSRLKVLLGLPAEESVTLSGDLSETPLISRDILDNLRERSDIRILDEQIREVEAELQFARTLSLPDFGIRGQYSEEEGDRVGLAGIAISFPIFNRGQELHAVASARIRRLQSQRDALIRAGEAETRSIAAAFEQLRVAAELYRDTVLPLAEENETLALESYEGGQIGLAELILVRRDALESRRAFVDQLLVARLSAIELQTLAGALR